MEKIEKYFREKFFKDLGGENPPATTVQKVGEELRSLYGVSCPLPLAKLLSFCVDPPDECLGAFCPWPQNYWLPPADINSFEFMMGEAFRIFPLFANTLAVGCTGSGDFWLMALERSREETEVYLCEHDDLYEIHEAADSIPSFTFLNYLLEAQSPLVEDIELLNGRVSLRKDLELEPGPKDPFQSVLRVKQVYKQGRGLAEHLNGEWGGRTPKDLPESLVDDVVNNQIALPAEPLTVMWTLFFRDDESRLVRILDACLKHPSRVVRDSATLLSEILKGRTQVGPIEDILDLRRQALEK